MEMPKPTAEHRQLHRLAGEFAGEETMLPSPWGPGGKATGRYSCRVDIDGMFLLQDYVQEKEGRVSYRGHGVFGYDPQRACVTWYWVDSFGMPPAAPSRGNWDGDTIRFEHEPQGDQRGRYTYAFQGDDRFTFTIENSHDGGKTWSTFMEAHYERV